MGLLPAVVFSRGIGSCTRISACLRCSRRTFLLLGVRLLRRFASRLRLGSVRLNYSAFSCGADDRYAHDIETGVVVICTDRIDDRLLVRLPYCKLVLVLSCHVSSLQRAQSP